MGCERKPTPTEKSAAALLDRSYKIRDNPLFEKLPTPTEKIAAALSNASYKIRDYPLFEKLPIPAEKSAAALSNALYNIRDNPLFEKLPTPTEKSAAALSNPSYKIPDTRNPANDTSIQEKDKPITVRKETASEYKEDIYMNEVSKEFHDKHGRHMYSFDEGNGGVLCSCGDAVDSEVFESDCSEYGDDDKSSSTDELSVTDSSDYSSSYDGLDEEEDGGDSDEEEDEDGGDSDEEDGEENEEPWNSEYVDYSYLIAEAGDEHVYSDDEHDGDYSPDEFDDDEEEECDDNK